MRTYRNSLCKIVPPLKSPTITRLPFVVQSKTSPKANHHQLPLVNFSFSAKRVVFSISGSVQPLEKGQEASGFGSGVYKYSIGYFQVFSCQSSSIPTHGTHWVIHSWFIIQSDWPGNVRASGQIASNFLTLASWRLKVNGAIGPLAHPPTPEFHYLLVFARKSNSTKGTKKIICV